jgi:hypothetical protein
MWTASAGAVIGGHLYVFGGMNSSGFQAEMWRYGFANGTWHQETYNVSSTPPQERNGHTADSIGSSLIIFGGWNGQAYTNELWIYQSIDKTWDRIDPAPGSPRPLERNGHSSVAYGGEIYIFGGFKHIPAPQVFYNDFWGYNFITKTWRQINPATAVVPDARFEHSAVIYGSHMYIFGGSNSPDGSIYLSDFWRYGFETNVWNQIHGGGAQPGPRQGYGAAVVGSRLYLFAGRAAGAGPALNELWEFNLQECISPITPPGPPAPPTPIEIGDASVAVATLVFLLLLIGFTIAGFVFLYRRLQPKAAYENL